MASSQEQYGNIANYNITPKTRGDGSSSALETDVNGNLLTRINVNLLVSAPLNGQAKIAVTSTAVQLPSNILSNGVILTAKSTNAAPIVVGGSGVANTVDGTGNGYILAAGASVSWAVSNTNALYINGTSGDIVSFAGS
jgi:hypothetical protein